MFLAIVYKGIMLYMILRALRTVIFTIITEDEYHRVHVSGEKRRLKGLKNTHAKPHSFYVGRPGFELVTLALKPFIKLMPTGENLPRPCPSIDEGQPLSKNGGWVPKMDPRSFRSLKYFLV